ncbi:damage-inducible protein DinB [Pontibacter diazotrophicus]|uniref:Damage-inducible protein DinB n=1 Tax=Pontibacter diazotrophicus TaxID=1400979 RepID=A0A3D8KYI8_9BACT|nr:DinB family protein [Pontibacter diazotrophicus]RDV10260.1 damage-inducible protein DinB [Pontibacter diazotrophicus]
MNLEETRKQAASVITSADLLKHWQGHRSLTRRVIEAFPEKELFEFTVAGMRPFAAMAQELLAITAPGIRQVAGHGTEELNEQLDQAGSKASILTLWDEATAEIDRYWAQIPDERFHERIVAFGQYEGTVWSTILYFIDNEIHHRGQGYVYLRSLGMEPPYFWER